MYDWSYVVCIFGYRYVSNTTAFVHHHPEAIVIIVIVPKLYRVDLPVVVGNSYLRASNCINV